MKFSIEICRGNIIDIIKLAEDNNLIINSIEQGPINDEMMNIKVDFSDRSNIYDIDKFAKNIKDCNYLNSCDRI
ncbi:MAG: hypothetical protein RSG52_15115 [Terrisporobacter sp.]|uniref:hypothetical protein n=1 Tax=Terrisporobacter sp. TaxID=1965305 RepID=UPI002FC76D71